MDDRNQVLQRILAEHQCVSAVDVALAGLLADELCAEHPDADRIVRLRDALRKPVEPEPQGDGGPKADLSRLTDSEFAEWAKLQAKIYDQDAPSFGDMTPPRYDDAHDLVAFVEERLEQKGSHLDAPLDFGERARLLGLIGSVVGDLILVDQLCREHWGSYAGLPRESEVSEEAPSAEEPTAPADRSNVRRLDNLPGSAGLRSKRPLPLN